MKIKYMLPAGTLDEIDPIILSEIPENAFDKIKLLINMLPPRKTFIGKIEVVSMELMKSHHVKNGSIAIIEKSEEASEGDVFVDSDMEVMQLFKNDRPHTVADPEKSVETFAYRITDTAKKTWGIVRMIINPK